MNRKKLVRRTQRALILFAKWQQTRMIELTLNGRSLGASFNPHWKEDAVRACPLFRMLRAGGVVRFEP